MEYKFNDNSPIYKQLLEHFKIAIITREYKCGEKLPSVRDLALITKVNPNTIQRTLSELENISLIYTKRTSGKFVTDDKNVIDKVRSEEVRTLVANFTNEGKKLGLTKDEIISILKEKGETK